MTFWNITPREIIEIFLKKTVNKQLIYFFALCLFFSSLTFKAAAQEEEGVLIKDFEFYLPYRPPETKEVKLLKERRRQLQSIITTEKKNLDDSPDITKENITSHIKFLENSLGDLDEAIAKEGDTRVPQKELHEALKNYKNKELTPADMNEVTEQIEIAYQERGYILAKAVLPEQTIEDGILKIAISEGDVGEIKIDGQKYYNERVIRRNFLEQIKHGVFREELLEKGLLLSQEEVPSAKTRVVLEPGKKEGTSNLVLTTEDQLAIDWTLDFNNFGSEFIGKERYGSRFEITDPWWGSTFSLRGVTGNDNEDSFLTSSDWSIPLNMYGTRLNLSYLEGLYVVGQELADLGIDGNTAIYGMYLSQPLMRKRSQSLTFSLGYNNKYAKSYQQNRLQNIDDLDVFYAVLDYDSLDRYLGKNIVSLGYYWGSLNPDGVYPLTRTTAEHRFHKYYLSAVRIQRIYGSVSFILKATGQVSNQNLLPIEQMAIGGYGSVRGHDSSMFLGDTGIALSGELLSPPPFLANKIVMGQRVAQLVQFALFYDYGRVYYTDPSPGEYNDERLKGFGGGLRLFYKDLLSFKFDAAFPTKKKRESEDSASLYFYGNINLTSDEVPKLFDKISNIWSDDNKSGVSETDK